MATGLVQAVATWPAGEGGLAAARARVAALGQDAALADACAPLVGTDPAASSRVVDAQYGGILTSTSSVLVVLDQWRLDAAGLVHPGGTTLDVRLERTGRRWRVVDVFPARPGQRGDRPPGLARQVLGDARIRLPYAARADVATGQISSSVLGTLLAMAQRWLVDVSVVRSGHPFYVFGTNRPSDHPKGHAVDVWALDGNALVEPVHHPLAVERDAAGRGARRVQRGRPGAAERAAVLQRPHAPGPHPPRLPALTPGALTQGTDRYGIVRSADAGRAERRRHERGPALVRSP